MSSDKKLIFIIALLVIGAVWLFRLWYVAPKQAYQNKLRLLVYAIMFVVLAGIMTLKYLGIHVPVINP